MNDCVLVRYFLEQHLRNLRALIWGSGRKEEKDIMMGRNEWAGKGTFGPKVNGCSDEYSSHPYW